MSNPIAVSAPPPSTNTDDATSAPSNKLKRLRPLLILLVVIVAGILIWRAFFRTPPVPENIVPLSGRIEGDDSAVAAKTTGRLLEIHVREGDQVMAGEVIAVLDDQQVKAREE